MIKRMVLDKGYFIAKVSMNSNGQKLITIPKRFVDLKDGSYVKVFKVE